MTQKDIVSRAFAFSIWDEKGPGMELPVSRSGSAWSSRHVEGKRKQNNPGLY
jgi:hypothetical protein